MSKFCDTVTSMPWADCMTIGTLAPLTIAMLFLPVSFIAYWAYYAIKDWREKPSE